MKTFFWSSCLILLLATSAGANTNEFMALCTDDNLPALQRQTIRAIHDAVQGRAENVSLSCEQVAERLRMKKRLVFANRTSSFLPYKEPVASLEPLTTIAWLEEIRIEYLAEEMSSLDLSPLERLPLLKKLELVFGSEPVFNLEKLNGLEELHVVSDHLTNLSEFSRLHTLKVSAHGRQKNHIENLSLIHTAPDLARLEVTGYRLGAPVDFSVFSSVKTLTSLTLFGLDFETIDTVHELTSLEHLDIRISDIGRLVVPDNLDLPLKSLFMRVVTIHEGLEAIGNFSALKNLTFTKSGLRWATFLSSLHEVEDLDLSENNIVSVSTFSGLVNLKKANLSSNEISFIDYFKNLTEVEELDLSGNQIESIDGLKNMVNMRRLNIENNKVYNIDPLEKLVMLEDFKASHNKISDISVLDKLESLHALIELDLQDNKIFSAQGLEKFSRLEKLNLSDNSLYDIEALGSLTKLRFLLLHRNNIVDISPISSLIQLKTLSLGRNRIQDVGPLRTLKNISNYLSLTYNNISDVSPLESLKGQKFFLYLHGNPVSSDYCPAGMCEF